MNRPWSPSINDVVARYENTYRDDIADLHDETNWATTPEGEQK